MWSAIPAGAPKNATCWTVRRCERNLAGIKPQLERLLDFDAGQCSATLVDNATWTADVALLDFLRDVGKHVTVNQMMAKESVRSRLDGEHGISFTEFSYMLLQANDFRHLHDEHGVELQMGGSDQWGNITAGIDLIRRTSGATAHGLTWPLLLRSDGQKFGKSSGNAVWLSAERTSPFQFRQYWVQTDDADIAERLLRFSMRSVPEIEAVVAEHQSAPERRVAQRTLARELTELIHGPDAADAADAAADILFGGDPTKAPVAALDVVRREVPTTTTPAQCPRCPDRPARDDRPGQLAQRGPPAPRTAFDQGQRRATERRRRPGRASRCCTSATCCCARASTRITWWRFLPTEVDAGRAGR